MGVPKVVPSSNSTTRTSSVPKARAPPVKSAASSAQSSFEEDAPVPEGLAKCGICKRNFAEDRIETHQVICQKNKVRKRRVYDGAKKRIQVCYFRDIFIFLWLTSIVFNYQGTEAENFLKKPISAARAPKAAAAAAPKANNWRSKHEDFIKTIRAAKEMQAYLAKGGKLSDLPPPPPSENLDYVKCPHCERRFNQGAATRHIPLCQNMQHNKPKPKPASNAGKVTSFTKRR